MTRRMLAMIGLICTVGAGCASPRPSAVQYHVLSMTGATEAAVLDAAEGALAEHFRLARRDANTRRITTLATESSTTGGGERIGDVIGATRRERRFAEVVVEPGGDGVKVFCKVLVQEYDSEAHQVFSREYELDDRSRDTPAQRDAASTSEQNAVWRTKRRDKDLERRILRDVQTRLGGAESS